MKRLFLFFLTIFCFEQLQAQLVHSARDSMFELLNKAKTLVTNHPYATVMISCTAIAGYWFFIRDNEDDEDPSYGNFERYWRTKSSPKASPNVSPMVSPTNSSGTLLDFTGDFPDPSSSKLHPTKLRHN